MLRVYFPASQALQSVTELLPLPVLYLPASQAVQEGAPLEDHAPAGHGCSPVPDPQNVPGLQARQLGEEEPLQQFVHVLPALQSVQLILKVPPHCPLGQSPNEHAAEQRVAKRISWRRNNSFNILTFLARLCFVSARTSLPF